MQIKNIILSAAAALAMVSAAPIDQTTDHAAAIKALGATPGDASTSGVDTPDTNTTPAPTEGLNFGECTKYLDGHHPEGLSEAEKELSNACNACNACWNQPHPGADDIEVFFETKCPAEAPTVDSETIKARGEAVTGLPTTLEPSKDAPQADTSKATPPKVVIPQATTPEVSDVKAGDAPTVNTAGKSA